ncbi:MAG: protein-L-isoaspartate(D-aspartate) O-methyltransferase [Rhizobacter sp.]
MSDQPRSPKFPLRLEQTAPKRGEVEGARRSSGLAGAAVLRPQAPLAHAASATQTVSIPTGLGLDSADVRRRMVARLQSGGITHGGVLGAFQAVPRHLFVDTGLVNQAYEDTSLPIGHGQTISKPSVVARMLELLTQGENAALAAQDGSSKFLGRVLEIGTGCGYQAALLSLLAKSVISVERLKPLHDKAREHLGALRSDNLRLVYGDGMLGHPPNAPYDSIIAAAGGQALPQAWLDQLAVGGRLIAPVAQEGGQRAAQVLVVVDRTLGGFRSQILEGVLFVPLKSGFI